MGYVGCLCGSRQSRMLSRLLWLDDGLSAWMRGSDEVHGVAFSSPNTPMIRGVFVFAFVSFFHLRTRKCTQGHTRQDSALSRDLTSNGDILR